VLWWSPDPREVLLPQEFHLSRRFVQSQRTRSFEWRCDRDFAAVVAACAAPRARSPGTWITPEMSAAYCRLHQRGLAHSYETWRGERLVGGLYGVRLGRVFFGESMFSREADASKAALAGLVQRSAELGIELIDCQLPSAHLRSLGSRAMPRAQFLRFLQPA
jgi:leucyl/phenylalanyl-tRNA--protein transferase